MMEQLNVSERRVCRALNQPRSTQRYRPKIRASEERLVEQMTDLATKYGRYGYRRITALLQRDGWEVNHKRVERLWRREGLKVPQKQPKRKRLWLNDGSCIRLRPLFKDHVWSYDFVATRTEEGLSLRILTLIDEYTKECLILKAARRLRSQDVLEQLGYLLRSHFTKKRYKKEGFVVNGKLDETNTIFFRGRDGKNRMILLMLTTPKIKKGEAFEEAVKNVSLQLSYLLNPDNPDILTVKDDDF